MLTLGGSCVVTSFGCSFLGQHFQLKEDQVMGFTVPIDGHRWTKGAKVFTEKIEGVANSNKSFSSGHPPLTCVPFHMFLMLCALFPPFTWCFAGTPLAKDKKLFSNSGEDGLGWTTNINSTN